MRTPRNNPKPLFRRLLPFGIIILAFAGISAGAFTILKQAPAPETQTNTPGAPVTSTNYNPPTPEQTQTGDTIKSQGNTGSDPSPTPAPSVNSSKQQVGIEITATNQSSSAFSIRTLLQTVSSIGTCTLDMSGPGGKSYSATASVQAGPSTSTCTGFDVPMSSLIPGEWTVKISFENENLGAAIAKEVTIQ